MESLPKKTITFICTGSRCVERDKSWRLWQYDLILNSGEKIQVYRELYLGENYFVPYRKPLTCEVRYRKVTELVGSKECEKIVEYIDWKTMTVAEAF